LKRLFLETRTTAAGGPAEAGAAAGAAASAVTGAAAAAGAGAGDGAAFAVGDAGSAVSAKHRPIDLIV
jgi:hypothetical protein